jgi:hypothetical protein
MGNMSSSTSRSKPCPDADAAIRGALRSSNEVAKAAYGKSFAAVVQDNNHRTRNQRIRQLSG